MREVRAELFKEYVSPSTYIGTVHHLNDKAERRRMVAVLDNDGFTCKLTNIRHNTQHITFNYVVCRKRRAVMGEQ